MVFCTHFGQLST